MQFGEDVAFETVGSRRPEARIEGKQVYQQVDEASVLDRLELFAKVSDFLVVVIQLLERIHMHK